MSERSLSPPNPEVVYLPAMFRRINDGDIRVPAFQREFVWTEDQITKLLESVYKGYPIGSILMWRVNEEKLKVDYNRSIPFPEKEESYPLSFVLDGMQRLSSLYGVFHAREFIPDKFNIVFNLQEEIFIHESDVQNKKVCISPSDLFKPKKLLDTQQRLSDVEYSEQLIDKTVNLQSSFQEYLIPTVTIKERSVDEVVSIFERINSTGTLLSTVDFMRALTWSEKFDLNREISEISSEYESVNFEIEDDTFVKLLSISLDIKPESDAMLKLRRYDPETLKDGISEVRRSLRKVISLLAKEFNIESYDYVPYEGQLLGLAKLFMVADDPESPVLDVIKRWFWGVSLGEQLRGKPDHHVSRMLGDIEAVARGDFSLLNTRLDLSVEDVLERKFRSRQALSSGVACLFAHNKAMSLVDGNEINTEFYMDEFTKDSYAPLFSSDVLEDSLGIQTNTSRIMSNMVVVKEGENSLIADEDPQEILYNVVNKFEDDAKAILESQMVPPEAVEMILSGEISKFLQERAEYIHSHAKEVTS